MNSYKQWKELNESFGPGAFTLGMAQPTNLGLNMGQFSSVADMLEGKKKKDAIIVDVDDDDDDDAEEVGEGCGCGAKSKKKSKKKSAKNSSKKSAKKMSSDMSGDFEDDDGEDHDDHDDDEGDDDHDHDDDEGDDDHDHDDDEGDDEGKDKGGEEEAEAPMFSKKKSGKKSAKKSEKKSEKKSAKKSAKKSEKKMQKESSNSGRWQMDDEDSWMKSVKEMLGPTKNTKNGDGWTEYQEDALLPANDAKSQEAKPGEPGFAPNGRLDVGFNSDVSLGEAFKVIKEACRNADAPLQEKLIKKLARLHNSLL